MNRFRWAFFLLYGCMVVLKAQNTSTSDTIKQPKLLSVSEQISKKQKEDKDTIRPWSINGQNKLTMNQAAFSNWIAGGTNNIGWIAGVNYNFTYERGTNLLENIVQIEFGQNSNADRGVRKTQDILNLSSNYGKRIFESWYISAGSGLQTQLAEGYDYEGHSAVLNDQISEDGFRKISGFMAPGYISAGIGVTYKPSDDFSISLRPASARWTIVMLPHLQRAGNYGLQKDGDFSLLQIGLYGSASYLLKIMENITYLSKASFFSNYLNHPERVVVSYSGNLNMKVNKFISAVVTADLLYDHNQIMALQVKQTLGVGLAYTFSNGVKRSKNKHNQIWRTGKI